MAFIQIIQGCEEKLDTLEKILWKHFLRENVEEFSETHPERLI